MRKYLQPGIHNQKIHKESEVTWPEFSECLLIIFQGDDGNPIIRHRKDVPPELLKEFAEKIIEIAKRMQQ
jgi:hypothetical protein